MSNIIKNLHEITGIKNHSLIRNNSDNKDYITNQNQIKVYCNQCQYCYYQSYNEVLCNNEHYITYDDHAWGQEIIPGNALKINKNNDCKYFKPYSTATLSFDGKLIVGIGLILLIIFIIQMIRIF